ncbi:MAG: PepSY domain-containing protein [Peptostreptococcaceae bacterium]|nr:PepSY domain-containing protein [Peptostreptococcaceae bacterium]
MVTDLYNIDLPEEKGLDREEKKLNKKRMSLAAIAIAGAVLLGGTSIEGFAAPASKGTIGAEKAKSIALSDAKLKAKDVSFVKVKLDKDDGKLVYDVEFYAGNVEYDYEIDAKTGKIREKDMDIEDYTIPVKSSKGQKAVKPQTSTKGNIGVEKAKNIALKDAGLKANQVAFVKAKLDNDDGKAVYDVEFYSNNVEYDYEIDAKTGKILEKDKDIDDFSIPSKSSSNNASTGLIGAEKAKNIALNHAGLKASQVKFARVELDKDDGKQKYEVEFYSNGKEYDYEIDAKTGKILSVDYDMETDFDGDDD